MKSINITAIILLISSIYSFGQPVITFSNFPANSQATIYTVSEDNLVNLNVGNSGQNQLWDYSGVTVDEVFFFSVCCEEIAPVSTYYAQFFPNANYRISTYSVEGDNYTKFYNISNNLMEQIGTYYLSTNSPTGIPNIYYFIDYATFLEFPYNFNDTFSDTSQLGSGSPSTTKINTYDSYGTLITPFATYHNVIRNKIIDGNNVKYVWYSGNPFFEIMNIQSSWSGNNLINNSCEIRKNLTFLSVQENKENSFSIYPNPTSDILIIDNNNFQKDLTLTIYDALGNTIIDNTKLDATSSKINLDILSNGLYFIEIKDKNQRIIRNDKIVKN